MPRENTVEKSRVHFSWQAQHFVTCWEIAGARNVVFFNTKSSPRSDREGLPKRRVRDDDFIVGFMFGPPDAATSDSKEQEQVVAGYHICSDSAKGRIIVVFA